MLVLFFLILSPLFIIFELFPFSKSHQKAKTQLQTSPGLISCKERSLGQKLIEYSHGVSLIDTSCQSVIQQKQMMSEQKEVLSSQTATKIGQNTPKNSKTLFVDQVMGQSGSSKNILKEDRFKQNYNSQSKQIQLFPQILEKQCEGWTSQQENILYQLHNSKGNKWVQIARQLKKSDNSVKNHYHSKLRKTLRKLNDYIAQYLQASLKPLKNNIISKIVQTAQGIYQNKQGQQKQLSLRAYTLKNRVLSFSQNSQQQDDLQEQVQIKKLIDELLEFQNLLKVSLKSRNKVKLGSNKYKGKEILSLLNQNNKRQIIYPRVKITKNPITVAPIYHHHPESGNPQEIGQQEDKNLLFQSTNMQTTQTNIRQPNFCSSFSLYNPQNVCPVPPLFYQMYQQPEFGIPSFSLYNIQSELFRFSFDGFNGSLC